MTETTNETPEEKAKRLGVPLIPAHPMSPGPRRDGIISVCGACGLELHQVMGYCCPRGDCPTGLGGTQCLM